MSVKETIPRAAAAASKLFLSHRMLLFPTSLHLHSTTAEEEARCCTLPAVWHPHLEDKGTTSNDGGGGSSDGEDLVGAHAHGIVGVCGTHLLERGDGSSEGRGELLSEGENRRGKETMWWSARRIRGVANTVSAKRGRHSRHG